MLTPDEIKNNVHDYIAANLPGILSTASLDDFEDYVNGTPSDAGRSQCCAYLGQNTYDETRVESETIVQMALPGEFGPDKYLGAVIGFMYSISARHMAQALNKRVDVTSWYPHEIQQGQSTFILFSLKFSEPLDSCG